MLGEEQHHLSARLGATRLDKAQMAGRDAGINRKLELAEVASLTPFPKLPTELARATSKSHRDQRTRPPAAIRLPPR